MIKQFAVPKPAAGQPFVFVVPGQYVARILSVTGTLSSLGSPSTASDASGNGRDMTYDNATNSALTYGNGGPYGGGANNFAVKNAAASGAGLSIAHRAASTDFNFAQWTVIAWQNHDTILHSSHSTIAFFGDTNPLTRGYGFGQVNGTFNLESDITASSFQTSVAALVRGTWQHVALSFDGANLHFYIGGVLDSSPAAGFAAVGVAVPSVIGGLNIPSVGGFGWEGLLAGVAVFNSALAAATISGFVAASTTNANYRAAVNAATPAGLWMLDEANNTNQRTPNLTVTDGTNIVGEYPAPTPTGTGSPYTWTWLAEGAGNNTTPSQGVTLVTIPSLTLPPGYVVTVTTPDAGSGDQWSNVVVWADVTDSGGSGPGTVPGSAAYLDRLLVPDYSHRGL